MNFETIFDVINFYLGKPNNPLNGKTFAEIAKEYNVAL
jgi:hypothetical protein